MLLVLKQFFVCKILHFAYKLALVSLQRRCLSCSKFTGVYHHQNFHPSRWRTLIESSWIPAAGGTDGYIVSSALINIPGESRFTWLASGRAGGTPKLCCTPGGESRHCPAGCRWHSGSAGPPFPPGWQTQRRTRRPDSLPPCTSARPPGRGPGTTSPSCRATWSVSGEKIYCVTDFIDLSTGIVASSLNVFNQKEAQVASVLPHCRSMCIQGNQEYYVCNGFPQDKTTTVRIKIRGENAALSKHQGEDIPFNSKTKKNRNCNQIISSDNKWQRSKTNKKR